MSPFEMIVALAGLVLAGFIFAKITGLIKSWINRNKGAIPEEAFDRLAKAFVKHKKNTENRIRNLEAIILEEDAESKSDTVMKEKELEAPDKGIEIEDQESKDELSSQTPNNNLRNMLRK